MEKYMKNILQDIVAHTHALGFIPVVKVSATDTDTIIEAMAEDKSVIIQGKTKTPVLDFTGTFGMPNLNKLDIHLKCPEYKENASIKLISKAGIIDGVDAEIPSGLHFKNEVGDFQNDYRFMTYAIINEKLKSVTFKGAAWNIEFEPSVASIQRLKYQQTAHTEETIFQVSTEDDNLIFSFGDSSTHAGSFVFQANITGKLKQSWSWPIAQTISILSLPGNLDMKISDSGAMLISVDSGIADYNYILPAQTK